MATTEDIIMPFGKHKGETLGDILASNPTYLDWLNGQEWCKGALKVAVKEICAKYAAEIDRAIEDKGKR